MNKSAPLVVLSAILLSQTAQAEDPLVFHEADGKLVVEIESSEIAGDWGVATSIADFQGASYYIWNGSNFFNVNSAGQGVLSYTINITNPGNYEFRWRSYIGLGDDFREHNDSWVRFPTGTNVTNEEPLSGWTKAYMNKIDDWSWATATVDHYPKKLRQYYAAGQHTIEISGRSTGHALDRFVLYKYDDVTWDDSAFTDAQESVSTGGSTTGGSTAGTTTAGSTTAGTTTAGSTTSGTTTAGSTTSGTTTAGSTTSGTTTAGSTTSGTTTTGTNPLPDWTTTESQLPAGECNASKVALAATDSIYTDSAGIINNELLKIDDGQRKTYLKFDLRYLPTDLTSASLTFSTETDSGSGTILISTGSQSTWIETDLDPGNLPDSTLVIDSFEGEWFANSKMDLPLDTSALGSEFLTLILEMEAGADDVSIDNSGTSVEPQLIFNGSTSTFCEDYALLQPTPESNEGTDGEEEGENTDENDVPDTEQATNGIPDSGGSGSISAISMAGLGLALCGIYARRLTKTKVVRSPQS